MNTVYLREFVLIAQVQGFERAAALLFTTQSSLSKHIKRLEEGLNVALFDRSSRRATLTPAGEALLPLAREMLAQEDRILKEIQTLQPGQRTVLSLGSIANIAAYQLGSLFQRFQEEYPLCCLNLCGGAPQEMHQRLLSGERELVFLRYDQQTDMSAINVIPFTTDRLVAVCPSTHPFALCDSVTLQDLAGEHIISFAEGSFMHEFIQSAFRREGLTPNIVMSAHRTDNLLYFPVRNSSAEKNTKKRNPPIPEQNAVRCVLPRNRGISLEIGAPGGIRTHGLPLRSAKKRSPLMPFGTPGVPYFTGFLTFLSVRISLQNTPVFLG